MRTKIRVFFFNFVILKIWKKIQNFRKLVEFTLSRKNIPKISQFFLLQKNFEKKMGKKEKKRNPVSSTLEVCGCQR